MAFITSSTLTTMLLGKTAAPSSMMKMAQHPKSPNFPSFSSIANNYRRGPMKMTISCALKQVNNNKDMLQISSTTTPNTSSAVADGGQYANEDLILLQQKHQAAAVSPKLAYLADGAGMLQLLPSYEDSDSDVEDDDDYILMCDGDAVKIKLVMPGVLKDLKLWFDTLALNFEAITEDDEFEKGGVIEGAVEIPMGLLQGLKLKETKVDLKDGVLKVVIPKLKLEERDDVVIVNVNSLD